jgi:Ser/Thr protein kinase RdoA (MazF antagonist)
MRSEMIEQRISGLFSLFGPSSQKEIYLSSSLTNGVTYPLARSLQENVLTHYALGNPVTCRLLIHGFADHYLIQTPEGRFVLRVYQAPRATGHSWRTASEIRYEVDLSLHLKRKGIAVSVPIARKDGTFLQSLQAAEGERYAVLFTYLEGEELSPASMDEAKSLFYGSAVAEMHNAADDFMAIRQSV